MMCCAVEIVFEPLGADSSILSQAGIVAQKDEAWSCNVRFRGRPDVA